MGDLGVYSVKFNKYITIKLVIVICDAPVYSDVRCTVNHNRKLGYDMYVVGRHLERWTFSSEHNLQSDDDSRQQIQPINHQGLSDF